MNGPHFDPTLHTLLRTGRALLSRSFEALEARLGEPDGARWLERTVARGDSPFAATGLEAAARDLARRVLLAADHRIAEASAGQDLEDLEAAFGLFAERAAPPLSELAARAVLELDDARDPPPRGPRAPREPGRCVGSYELLEPIGGGASGVVYRARHTDSGHLAALKLLRIDALDADHVLRFRREAQIVARLHHPAIARVLDSGVHDDGGLLIPYLVVDLVEGRPFDEFAHAAGRERTLEAFALVCEAVQHAHDNGVVHRDLKSANVLVGIDGRPHVLDFGIARLVGSRAPEATATGRVLGTPAYMSPEQARGGALDERSDVWGLGAVLFEALAGAPPHDLADLTADQALLQVARGVTRRVEALRPDIDHDLAAVIDTALAPEPDQRY
jgi:serine/threonine protein kinase